MYGSRALPHLQRDRPRASDRFRVVVRVQLRKELHRKRADVHLASSTPTQRMGALQTHTLERLLQILHPLGAPTLGPGEVDQSADLREEEGRQGASLNAKHENRQQRVEVTVVR